MQCTSLTLQGVQNHIGYDNLINILEPNLKMYYDLALLCIGGWTDVAVSTTSIYGGDPSKLHLVDDPNYTPGQVWQAARKDFVWETGINYLDSAGQVHDPSGVGVPIVNSVATSEAYYVDYPNGQIIFTNPIPTTSTVCLSHAYRYVQIYTADKADWWQELQFNSHRVDSTQFSDSTGDWSIFNRNRVQMPAVVIEAVPKGTAKGWELGSSSKIASRDILFHIYAETKTDCQNLSDIFSMQSDRKIALFNTNEVSTSGAYPLDYRGELLTNNHYENLIASYRWKTCRIVDSTMTEMNRIHSNLYSSVVRTTTETIL